MFSAPGIIFLVNNLPRLLIPPAFVGLVALLCRSFDRALPVWFTVVLCLLSWPVNFLLSVKWFDYVTQKEARARGARLPPVLEHQGLGNREAMAAVSQMKEKGYLADPFFRWSGKYGPIVNLRVLFRDRIFTTEPAYIKNLLAAEFPNHEKGPRLREQLQALLGTGVFNSDGDMWKFHRGMTRPFFSKDRISHLQVFERHADHALQKAKERFRQGYAVDWQDLVSRFTLDSATEFLFGQDLKTLSANLPYPSTSGIPRYTAQDTEHPADRFSRAFAAAQEVAAKRGFRGESWPLFEFWEDGVKRHMGVVNDFIEPIVQKALQDKKEKGMNGTSATDVKVSEDETLLSHLVNLSDDPTIIRDETLNILLAGRDTTANTLTFAVYMLAEHPDVLQRLRQEILDRVGPSNPPTLEDIREMKYLRAVINETLRLYPAVPFNQRTSTVPTVWESTRPGEKGFYIRAGTKVTYSVFVMHRRKDLWGPDALDFDPDRFIDARMQKYLVPNPFIFLPFNAGPRICLGQQFAYNETSFMLVRLLQQFSAIELAQEVAPESKPPPEFLQSPGHNGKEKVWVKSHLTMYAYNGLWVKMVEAPSPDTF